MEMGTTAVGNINTILDSLITNIESHAKAIVPKIKEATEVQELDSLLKFESEFFPLLGVTMAYEPYMFSKKKRLFAPFYDHSRDSMIYIEEVYDYTDSSLNSAKWYTDAIDNKTPIWHQPTYGEAANELGIDYGVPIKNKDGDLIGVLDYTISLEEFSEVVDSLSVGPAGYGFTLLPEGTFITHPNKERLLTNIKQIHHEDDRLLEIEKMLKEEKGVISFKSRYTFTESYYFFNTSIHGWKSVIVFTEEGDSFAETNQGRHKLIHLYTSVSFLLFVLICYATGFHHLTDQRLWIVSSAFSLILAINIGLIWKINFHINQNDLERDINEIVNETELNKVIDAFAEEKRKSTNEEFHYVPTGVYLETIIKGPYFSKLAGEIWMRTPKDIYEKIPPGFKFLKLSSEEFNSVKYELISEVEVDGDILTTWYFRANVRQNSDFSKYPFDLANIQLMIAYPAMEKNVILVPDLESYEVLNPTFKPGISEMLFIPNSKTIASFFTFESIDYKSTFGDRERLSNFPVMVFNVTLKRAFANPFVTNFIPIIIIKIILFMIIISSSKKPEGNIGITTMNVIQSCAGFLFVMVLAHINQRNTVLTPEITYIEYFYFSSYLFIAFNAMLLAGFMKGVKWKYFEFGDNLIMKLLFWPSLILMWYLSTLFTFY